MRGGLNVGAFAVVSVAVMKVDTSVQFSDAKLKNDVEDELIVVVEAVTLAVASLIFDAAVAGMLDNAVARPDGFNALCVLTLLGGVGAPFAIE